MAEKTGNTEFYKCEVDSELNGSHGTHRVVNMVDTEYKDERGTWWELEFETLETRETFNYDDYVDVRAELVAKYEKTAGEYDADGYLIQ